MKMDWLYFIEGRKEITSSALDKIRQEKGTMKQNSSEHLVVNLRYGY